MLLFYLCSFCVAFEWSQKSFRFIRQCNIIMVVQSYYALLMKFQHFLYDTQYTGWLVTGGTSGKGMILREKRSRKYRIKIFRLRLCFRENRLWIFTRYLTVDRCLGGYYRSLSLFCRNGKLQKLFIYYYKNCWKCCPFCRTHTSALLIKFLWTLSNTLEVFINITSIETTIYSEIRYNETW